MFVNNFRKMRYLNNILIFRDDILDIFFDLLCFENGFDITV